MSRSLGAPVPELFIAGLWTSDPLDSSAVSSGKWTSRSQGVPGSVFHTLGCAFPAPEQYISTSLEPSTRQLRREMQSSISTFCFVLFCFVCPAGFPYPSDREKLRTTSQSSSCHLPPCPCSPATGTCRGGLWGEVFLLSTYTNKKHT